MSTGGAERFWDRRAREDAFFFVDTRQRFKAPELERFWQDGERAVATILEVLGIELTGEERMVEVGCGVGRLTRALAGRVREVHALDVSGEMLALAEEHNSGLQNVRWVHGDGHSLRPLPDAGFDACLSYVVFQHLPDPAITLGYVREMARVLRPRGWAAFQVSTDPAVHRPRRGAGTQLARLRAIAGRAPRGQHDPAWLGSAVTVQALQATAECSGLEIERLLNPGSQFCLVLARRRP